MTEVYEQVAMFSVVSGWAVHLSDADMCRLSDGLDGTSAGQTTAKAYIVVGAFAADVAVAACGVGLKQG